MDPRALYQSDDTDWLAKPDALVETSWVERKEWTDARKLGEQVSSFANGQPPGGLIVVGVATDGAITGVQHKNPDELVRRLKDTVDGQMGRDWEYRQVATSSGHLVLYVFVPFSEKRVLCLSDGSAYRRIGNSTVQLSLEEIVELRDARGEKRIEVSPITKFSTDQLEMDVANTFYEGVIAKNGLTLPIDLPQAMENKRLLTRSGSHLSLTVAGAVALARDPTEWLPGARLRFIRFEGTVEKLGTERNVIRDRWFDGPIPIIVRDFVAFMQDQVRQAEYLGQTGTIIREPEYPDVAWKEAVVNALVHRSYSLQNTPVFVRMFDDRLEVESPGGFPGANRPDSEGLFPIPFPRNPILAGALQYLNLVWMAREGTRRMHDTMQEMGLPLPEYCDDRATKVVVTLRNDWERRKNRSGANDTSERWAEVEGLLKEDLAFLRKRGFERWRGLTTRGSTPTKPVLALAETQLQNPSVSVEEKKNLLELLSQLPDDVVHGLATRLVPQVLGGLFRGEPDLVGQVPYIASRFDDMIEVILQALESTQIPPDGPHSQLYGSFLYALQLRLGRDPLPSREWLNRVVTIASRGGPANARDLYFAITGKRLG